MVQNLFRIRKENTSKLNLLSNISGFEEEKKTMALLQHFIYIYSYWSKGKHHIFPMILVLCIFTIACCYRNQWESLT